MCCHSSKKKIGCGPVGSGGGGGPSTVVRQAGSGRGGLPPSIPPSSFRLAFDAATMTLAIIPPFPFFLLIERCINGYYTAQ